MTLLIKFPFEVKQQEALKNSRFVLLKNKENLTDKQQIIFEHIQAANYQGSMESN